MSEAAAAAAVAVAVAEAGVVVVVDSLPNWPSSEVATLMLLGGVPFTGAGGEVVVEADCCGEAGDPHTFLWLRGPYSACKEGGREGPFRQLWTTFELVYRRFAGVKSLLATVIGTTEHLSTPKLTVLMLHVSLPSRSPFPLSPPYSFLSLAGQIRVDRSQPDFFHSRVRDSFFFRQRAVSREQI